MEHQPESFTAAAEIVVPSDARDILRDLAKAARKARRVSESYPRRTELMAILADARVRIDRINEGAT